MVELDKDINFRCYVLDSLISKSGEYLKPELIGALVSEIVEGAKEIYQNKSSRDEIRLKNKLK